MAEESWKKEAEQAWLALATNRGIQWFATKETPHGKRVMGGHIGCIEEFIGAVDNARKLCWNFYANANPVDPAASGKQKVSAKDISLWRYIIVDLDPIKEYDYVSTYIDIWLDGAATNILKNAIHIYTGRGYQYWIPLTFSSELERAEAINRGVLKALQENVHIWAPGYAVDFSCTDLSRVVRVPGSVNQKTYNEARFIPSVTYTRDWKEFEEYEDKQDISEPLKIVCANLMTAIPHLNGSARQFLLGGVVEPGRHKACFAACKTLHELGIDEDLAHNWLFNGAWRCIPKLDESDLNRIVRQVYGS